MSYLLDTNVVWEIRRQRPDPGVMQWFDSVRADQLYLSVMVVGQIRHGIERLARRDPGRVARKLDSAATAAGPNDSRA